MDITRVRWIKNPKLKKQERRVCRRTAKNDLKYLENHIDRRQGQESGWELEESEDGTE